MSSGLIALLDDVAALVKASAASLDDISTQVAKTTGKVSGIVIDDAAVTPKFVIGLSPDRELSIISTIAKKSLINKIFILSPLALALGYFIPWIISPILMLGGCYLCYEGYEKVYSLFFKHKNAVSENSDSSVDPLRLEKMRISSAVRTDLILSSEIVAITYSNIVDDPFFNQVMTMLGVGLIITFFVYGFVALIVKADDFGLYLVNNSSKKSITKVGELIVKGMPSLLNLLSYVGTIAMLYVGFGIIVHGVPFLHMIDQQHWTLSAFVTVSLGILLGFTTDLLIRLIKENK